MTQRRRYRRTAFINLAGNLTKLLLEGTLGLWYGSTALLADAADSLTDLLTNGLALVVGERAYKEEDEDHPHGHERFEPLAAFIVGFVMVVAGARIGVGAFNRFMHASAPDRPGLLLVGALGAIVIKTGLYWYNRQEARGISSTSLKALAVDARNDIWKSMGVAAGIIGLLFGFPAVEAGIGIAISIVVLYNGVRIMQENAAYLVGAAPSGARVAAIRDELLDDGAVHGIHDLVVYHAGPSYEVEVHVEVDGNMTLREAHDVETRLVRRLRGMEQVGDAHVHLDPSGIGEWKAEEDDQASGEEKNP